MLRVVDCTVVELVDGVTEELELLDKVEDFDEDTEVLDGGRVELEDVLEKLGVLDELDAFDEDIEDEEEEVLDSAELELDDPVPKL